MSWGVNPDNISEIFHERSHQSRENREMVCYACACFRRGAAKAFCSWFKARLNTCPESAMDETTRTQRSYRDKLCICMRGAQRLISGPLQSVSAAQRSALACLPAAARHSSGGATHTQRHRHLPLRERYSPGLQAQQPLSTGGLMTPLAFRPTPAQSSPPGLGTHENRPRPLPHGDPGPPSACAPGLSA